MVHYRCTGIYPTSPQLQDIDEVKSVMSEVTESLRDELDSIRETSNARYVQLA